jgi:mannosyl-oligosaccharide alpha-1,2-mannosidase
MRLELYQQQLEIYKSETAAAAASATAAAAAATKAASGPLAVVTEAQDSARNPPPEFAIENKAGREHYVEHSKRQLDNVPGNVKAEGRNTPSPTIDDVLETEFTPPSHVVDAPPPVWSPTKPLTRDEFAKNRIEDERLAPGLRQINDPRYILR